MHLILRDKNLRTISRIVHCVATNRSEIFHLLLVLPVCDTVHTDTIWKPFAMADSAAICTICDKEESDMKRMVECVYCHKCEHLKCKNIIGNAVRKIRERPYFCSLQCQEFHHRELSIASTESQVLRELQTVLLEVRETKTELMSMKSTMGDIEKFQNFLSDKLDDLFSEVTSLKSDQGVLRSDVTTLYEKDRSMNVRLSSLEMDFDRINRTTLARNAVLLGIPMRRDEEPKQIVCDVAAAVGYELEKETVVEARRLVKSSGQHDMKPAPIKVTFRSEVEKENLFNKKRSHGKLLLNQVDSTFTDSSKAVVLRDELTNYGVKLLKEARDIQVEAGFKFVWSGRNGAILMKKNESAKVEIVRCEMDLDRIRKANQKRLARDSSSSPEAGPAPKRR